MSLSLPDAYTYALFSRFSVERQEPIYSLHSQEVRERRTPRVINVSSYFPFNFDETHTIGLSMSCVIL